MWFSPVICPLNFEEGPQIFARFTFFDIPLRIFSAASSIVEFCFSIIGFLPGGFFDSFV